MPVESAGFSRVCTACGRRVPRSVTRCRCGAEVADAAATVAGSADSGQSRSAAANAVIGVLLLAAVAGTVYWSFFREPARQAASAEPPPSTRPAQSRPATGQTEPAPAEPVSDARRAWEASLASANASSASAGTMPAAAAPTAPAATSLGLEDVVSRAMPAVVLVETSTGSGSAFFVRADTLLTNVHVVDADSFVKLRKIDGSTVSARVESRAPAFDIAVLKVSPPPANQAVIPLGSAETLRVGQEVITIGTALGMLQNSVSRGIVSGLRRSGSATLVQTDAAANPGNSGGPLLDRAGNAIGITTMGFRNQQGLNFAVAIDHARAILEGRVAAPPTTVAGGPGTPDLRALTPAIQSESERAVDAGRQSLVRVADGLTNAASQLDSEWTRFRQSCLTSPAGAAYQREWFEVLVPGRINASTLRGSCFSYHADFTREAQRFQDAMRKLLESARRAGLEPGEVREALRARRLEFDGWER